MPAPSPSLEQLEKICSKNPTSILFARLAESFLIQGHVKRATEICRQGLRYRPSYVAGHVVMGKCHLASGHFEEARQEFQKVLQLDEDHPAAFWHLGHIDLKLGWEDLAIRHFEMALEIDPHNKQLPDQIAELKSARKEAVPEDTFAQGEGMHPEFERDPSAEPDDVPFEAEAEICVDLEDKDSWTEEVPRPARITDPDLTALVFELAQGPTTRSEKKPKAGSAKPKPTKPMAIATSTLAELYAQQGLLSQAVATLKQVLQRDPHNERAMARLAELRA
jgi:hypothetical protein